MSATSCPKIMACYRFLRRQSTWKLYHKLKYNFAMIVIRWSITSNFNGQNKHKKALYDRFDNRILHHNSSPKIN